MANGPHPDGPPEPIGVGHDLSTKNPFEVKLFEILAALTYNTERGDALESVLKDFLVKRDASIDVVSEVRRIQAVRERNLRETTKETRNQQDDYTKSSWFQQDCVLSSNIPQKYIPEYVIRKFGPYAKEFEEALGFPVDALVSLSFALLEYLAFKKHMVRFDDKAYRFASKEEYADLGFVAIPDVHYTEKWMNVATLDLREVFRLLSGVLGHSDIESALNVLSLDIGNVPKVPEEIRLPSRPILRLDREKVVILEPDYLARGLPIVYEELSKQVRSFLDSKGRTFEALVQEDIKRLPFKSLAFNVEYGRDFEVDAVLEFKKTLWFTEAASHPPSAASLRGDLVSIERDLEKSVWHCLDQGRRCLRYLDSEPLLRFKKTSKRLGILIVVDGVYPQVNMTTALKLFHEEVPTYVVNWFDLRMLLDQSETERFEEFLIWRTIQPMPVVCVDEKDYWAYYFDHHALEPKFRKAFRMMQEKELKSFYISARFNSKDYVENIA